MAETRDDEEVFWVDPPERGVIFKDSFRLPKRFKTFRNNFDFEIRTNTCFREVMQACGSQEYGREETWISKPIIEAYCKLHEMGHCHSFEVFQNDRLIGGLYGLALGRAFFGESMFGSQTGASKIAFTRSAEILFEKGFHFIDTQFWTPHLSQFGCVEIKKADYEKYLMISTSRTPLSPIALHSTICSL